MDEPREPGGNAAAERDDEAEVRRLLAAAGRRPQVPEKDLAAITAAAHAAWRQAVSERRSRREDPGQVEGQESSPTAEARPAPSAKQIEAAATRESEAGGADRERPLEWRETNPSAREEEARGERRREAEPGGRRRGRTAAGEAARRTASRGAAEGGLRGRHRGPHRRAALAAAAVVLLALGLGAWWWQHRTAVPSVAARVETVRGSAWIETASGTRPLAEGNEIPAGAVVRTAADAGTSLSLRLDGDSELRLDAGTRLHLPPFADPASAADAGSTRATKGTTAPGSEPIATSDGRLAVLLTRGAVYADTGEGISGGSSSSALRVRTPIASADDVGTRFAVRLLEGPRPAMRVRVRAGAVAVERAGERWLAPAGEELVVAAEGVPRRRPVAAYGAGWEWVAGAAGFGVDGRTVAELLAWVTRETGWRLRWAEPGVETAARSIVLHGDFGDLPPERAAFAILPGADLEARLDGQVLVVSRRRPG
jgi:hypothetical protein